MTGKDTDIRKSRKTILSEAAVYFTLYSVFGWCYEVFLEVFIYHWGFTNRGVLFGPYCPVYGFGALAFLLCLYPLIKDRPLQKRLWRIPLIFILSLLIATALELATSYALEALTGSWPWQTYLNYKYNFQGRIALSPSVRFGIGGVLFLYILQPLFEKITAALGEKRVRIMAVILILIFAVDTIHAALVTLL